MATTKTNRHRATVFEARGALRRTLLEGPSTRVIDEYAHSVWDRYRRHPGSVGIDQLPRVLVEIDIDGSEHVIKTYPDD